MKSVNGGLLETLETDKYKIIVDDALKWLEKYKVEGMGERGKERKRKLSRKINRMGIRRQREEGWMKEAGGKRQDRKRKKLTTV